MIFKKQLLSQTIRTALLTTVGMAFSQTVFSAGFALNDHSATASGNALAGAAAGSADISYSFWNPALLSNAKSTELYISGAVVLPKMDVTVNSASDPAGNSLTGEPSSKVVDTTVVPSIYFAYPLTESTTLGASFNVPFGLSGKYGKDWAGRYHSSETAVKDMAVSFSVAQTLGSIASVGASVQIHKGSVLLASALTDFAGGKSAAGDGYGELYAEDIAVAYSIGFLVEPIEGTRLGVGYRSEVDFTFEGDATYTNVSPTLKNLGVDEAYLFDQINFPSVLTVSLEQSIGERYQVSATAMKTGWSSLDEMRIAFAPGPDNIKQPDSVLTFKFEDAWFYSAGLTYEASDNLTLRTGVAVDNSPAKDEYRSARTPDGDRKWVSLGGSYRFSNDSSITMAYTHVKIDDVSVNRTGALAEDASRGKLSTDYKLSADVVSFAYNMAF
ncbi:long-chain fatty acid transport protein [Oceanospirillum multiglobuliferum]|uniref:Aromatic hydrocarbon degradation protein n=1 Tax=Oceanospirillum multiglobuliferum TaxID=64969 RepID=A0A1T4P1A2_9GAMM|nr:outer membrane protein transport protein [Oceanospirillum multiglobuliferum]OPX55097.1 aromatic hydrocarbon degradation protein [Oceanospirillum multiglobuliferum]SJZ85229.1 long-chain fatty acid transport protein [Oceanospirillum multiglobuliferum]